MPLPDFLISAAALICVQFLIEKDDVISAIRIVDVYYVPELPADAPPDALPAIHPNVLVMLKAIPGYKGTHLIRLRLIKVSGEETVIGEHAANFDNKLGGLQETPTGFANLVASSAAN
jgi:hypothetical protein